jgi:hypothetical protein
VTRDEDNWIRLAGRSGDLVRLKGHAAREAWQYARFKEREAELLNQELDEERARFQAAAEYGVVMYGHVVWPREDEFAVDAPFDGQPSEHR